jgi:hypothetical protein
MTGEESCDRPKQNLESNYRPGLMAVKKKQKAVTKSEHAIRDNVASLLPRGRLQDFTYLWG